MLNNRSHSHYLKRLSPIFRLSLLASVVLVFTLAAPTLLKLLSPVATAQNPLIRYVPPLRATPAASGIRGSGSRGCSISDSNQDKAIPPSKLTLVIPSDHHGQTLSARPRLFIYTANLKQVVTVLALRDVKTRQTLLEMPLLAPQQGVLAVDLPASVNLEVGTRRYRWQVAARCNPARPSGDIFVQGWVERIDRPDLAASLNTATTPEQRAEIYAQNGLWYDAIDVLATAQAKEPQNPVFRDRLVALLQQVELPEVAEALKQQPAIPNQLTR